MVAVALFVGFVIGALVVIGLEVLGVLYFIQKLSKKVHDEEIKVANSELARKDELHFTFPNKQVSFFPIFLF